MLEGTTYYSEDGKKSVTITGKAPMRRDRYHADYYPVTIVDAKGSEIHDRLSGGVIRNRFPRTAPKPETGKKYVTAKQLANGIMKETGMSVLVKSELARYQYDYTRIGRGTSNDEWEILNLTNAQEVRLLEAGFQVRKVALMPRYRYSDSKLEAVDVWSK